MKFQKCEFLMNVNVQKGDALEEEMFKLYKYTDR